MASGGASGRRAFVNVRLLDPASGLDAPGALLIEDGRIAEVGPKLFADGVPSGLEAVDGGGHCLCPGLIDMHAFAGEPGAEHKETLATASAAAAAGGITTLISTPDTDPAIDDIALVELIKRLARDTAVVHVHTMAAITKGLRGAAMTEMGLLARAGAVAFTDGDHTVADALVMRRVLAYASTFDLLIDHLPQDPDLGAGGCINEGEVATRLGLAGIPAAAEAIVLDRDLRLAELTGARLHASRLTTGAALDAMRAAKARGLRVSCSITPHHFALNETAVGEYRTFAKVWPPLRSEEDRRALIKGLADGTVDVIASGHSPQDQESKRLPFAQAAAGISGLETMLPLALELHHNGHLPAAGGAGEDDGRAGPPVGPRVRGAGPRRARRSAAVRPRGAVADRPRPLHQQVQELAVREPPGAGPGAAHAGRRARGSRARGAGARGGEALGRGRSRELRCHPGR